MEKPGAVTLASNNGTRIFASSSPSFTESYKDGEEIPCQAGMGYLIAAGGGHVAMTFPLPTVKDRKARETLFRYMGKQIFNEPALFGVPDGLAPIYRYHAVGDVQISGYSYDLFSFGEHSRMVRSAGNPEVANYLRLQRDFILAAVEQGTGQRSQMVFRIQHNALEQAVIKDEALIIPMRDFERAIGEVQAERISLREELNQVRVELRESVRLHAKAEHDLGEKEAALEANRKEIETLKSQLSGANARIVELESENAELREVRETDLESLHNERPTVPDGETLELIEVHDDEDAPTLTKGTVVTPPFPPCEPVPAQPPTTIAVAARAPSPPRPAPRRTATVMGLGAQTTAAPAPAASIPEAVATDGQPEEDEFSGTGDRTTIVDDYRFAPASPAQSSPPPPPTSGRQDLSQTMPGGLAGRRGASLPVPVPIRYTAPTPTPASGLDQRVIINQSAAQPEPPPDTLRDSPSAKQRNLDTPGNAYGVPNLDCEPKSKGSGTFVGLGPTDPTMVIPARPKRPPPNKPLLASFPYNLNVTFPRRPGNPQAPPSLLEDGVVFISKNYR